MGETHSLFKLVIILGVMFLLIGTISPGADMAWTNFRSSISDFPRFSNPFESSGYSVIANLQQQFRFAERNATNVFSNRVCDQIKYYDCAVDADGPDFNDTFFSLNVSAIGVEHNADIGLNAPGVDWSRFVAFRVDLWCRFSVPPSNGNRTVTIVFSIAINDISTSVFGADDTALCPSGNEFSRVTFTDQTFTGVPASDAAVGFMEVIVSTDFGPNDGILDVSTLYVQVFFSGNATCTGAGFFGDISCQIVQFFRPVLLVIGFIVGSFIFAGQIIIWLLTVLGGFLLMITFFLAIPGAPSIVQGIITAIFIGILVFIGFVIFKAVRGSGSVG